MTVDLRIPALGESVSQATITRFAKKEGDFVFVDELILELETDKVSLEVNAPASGLITNLLAQEGDTVEVNQLVAKIDETQAKTKEKPSSNESSKLPNVDNKTSEESSKILSPAASRIVAENNINPNSIDGTGKDGRITKEDAMNASQASNVSSPSATTVQVVSSFDGSKPQERVKMSKLRAKIAERLKDSQNTAAILTTFNEVDMSNIMALRTKYKDEFEKKFGTKLGFMSFFVKASVNALKVIPGVNATIDGNDIVYKYYYDIGVAVGTEQGLVVPVVRNCDKLSFADIEKEIVNYGKKAKDGKLTAQDMSGGTFTISNGGVYGSLMSTPIINPPQSAILGMHKTMDRPVAINGKIEIRPMMYLALSYDHRLIDGKEAVTFLVKVKEAIESPERLLFDM